MAYTINYEGDDAGTLVDYLKSVQAQQSEPWGIRVEHAAGVTEGYFEGLSDYGDVVLKVTDDPAIDAGTMALISIDTISELTFY